MVKPQELGVTNAVGPSKQGESLRRCFSLLCDRWRVGCKDKILLNFAAAAFHLCYLLEVRLLSACFHY
jgi:hypothetical protein